MVVKVTKISEKMKNKSLLSTEKNIIEREKTPYYNYKKVFQLRNFCFFIMESIRNFFSFALMFESFCFSGFANSLLKYKKDF